MDFFDKVTKTIASTGQDAIQKTRVLTDTAKLNALCSEEENRISNYYRKIGELYVSLHADSNEPEFKELMEAIHQSKMKIQDWNKQIHNIKGTQICPNCGATIQRGSFFCTACGTKMPVFEQKTDKVLFCRKCGVKLDVGVSFCTSCGTPVEDNPTNRASVNQSNEEISVSEDKKNEKSFASE